MVLRRLRRVTVVEDGVVEGYKVVVVVSFWEMRVWIRYGWVLWGYSFSA